LLCTSRPLCSIRCANSRLGNIAFIIRHSQSSYGKQVDPGDIFIASRKWQGHGDDSWGIGVFVIGSGYTHTVFRITVKKDENTIDKLVAEMDGQMEKFFPAL
jgi:hypothetical protein